MSVTKHDGTRGVRYEVRYRGANGNERSKTFRTKRVSAAMRSCPWAVTKVPVGGQ